MLRALDVDFGNPSSMHWAGRSKQLIDRRAQMLPVGLDADPLRSSSPAGQPRRIILRFSECCDSFRQLKLTYYLIH